MLCGILAGHALRKVVHAIYFINDPVFYMQCTLGFVGCIADWRLGYPIGLVELALMTASYILGYTVGYTLCRPGDVLDVTTYTETFPGGFTERIATYSKRGKDGSFGQYWMPQRLSRVTMALIGFLNPLDLRGGVQRTFDVGQTNGLWTLKTKSVSIQTSRTESQDKGIVCIGHRKVRDSEGEKVTGPKRFLINGKVLTLTLIPATVCTEDRVTFLTKSGAYIDATNEAAELRAETERLRIELNAARYSAAGQMIEEMFSDLDRPETEDEVYRRLDEERKRRRTEVVADDVAADQ